MSLGHGGDLAPLHGLFQLFKGFFRNEFCGATLVYPAHQELLQTLLAVDDEPPLTLTPAVAQSLGHFSQGRTLLELEKLKHLHPVEQVAVSMALLQLLQLFRVFFDHPWVVYVRHAPIVPLMRRIGVTRYGGEDPLLPAHPWCRTLHGGDCLPERPCHITTLCQGRDHPVYPDG